MHKQTKPISKFQGFWIIDFAVFGRKTVSLRRPEHQEEVAKRTGAEGAADRAISFSIWPGASELAE